MQEVELQSLFSIIKMFIEQKELVIKLINKILEREEKKEEYT